MTETAIRARGLQKSFKDLQVLRGVDYLGQENPGMTQDVYVNAIKALQGPLD